MQTRYNKVLGKDVSLFGLGTMRMPTKVVDGKAVMDREECIRMIRHAIDSGVTYVDTAYPYHGGDSETAGDGAVAGEGRGYPPGEGD